MKTFFDRMSACADMTGREVALPASPFVLLASPFVLLASPFVLPAAPFVIPAQAGIRWVTRFT